DVVMRQRIAEEAEAVLAAPPRLLAIGMHRESRDHGDVGIDGVADRHALLLEDTVIVIDPLLRLDRIDEGEGERADAEPRRQLDGLAVGAGHPYRRMRLLQRLR